jgi:LysR family nitrogen assimilation transcriptional regulator
MELKQLRYFIRVADLGGFSKAALSLSISQPALSKKLRQLELELRRDLLSRNGRGVTLTDEGIVFLEHARIMLDQAERAKQELQDLTSPAGKVILACASGIGVAHVARIFGAFRERFPKASLEIIELKGWTVYEWLLHGRAEIGILHDAHPSSTMRIIPLRESELCLVSSKREKALRKGAPIPFKRLGKYPLILPGNPRAMRLELERAAEASGAMIDAAYQVEGTTNILELVNQGLGYTVMPRELVAQHHLAAKLQINPLSEPRLMSTLAVAVPAKRRLTFLAEQTVEIIRQAVGQGGKPREGKAARRS